MPELFHNIVRQTRKSQQKRLEDLAEPLGYDRSHVHNLEHGRALPRRRDIPIFAEVLGLDPDMLMASVDEFQESPYRRRKKRAQEFKPRPRKNNPRIPSTAMGKVGLTSHDLMTASPEKLIDYINGIASGTIPYAGIGTQG